MPVRPLKPCAAAGCRKLVRGATYCSKHQVQADQHRAAQLKETHVRYNKQRAASDRFYSSQAWKNARAAHLAKCPWCVSCKEHGRTEVAVVVDHVKERKKFPELELCPMNLRSLCRACDNRLRRDRTGRD